MAVTVNDKADQSFSLSWLANSLDVKLIDVHAILETFILHQPYLPKHVTKFLMGYELQLLTEYIWNEDDVYEYFKFNKVQNNFHLSVDFLSHSFNEKTYSVRAKYFVLRLPVHLAMFGTCYIL